MNIEQYFSKEFLKEHSRYHSYTERYNVIKEDEFKNGLINLLNNYATVTINTSDSDFMIDCFRGLDELIDIYYYKNYLHTYRNREEIIIQIDGIPFKCYKRIEYMNEFIELQRIDISSPNANMYDNFFDYDDIVNKTPLSNVEVFKQRSLECKLKELKEEYNKNISILLREYDVDTENAIKYLGEFKHI